MYFDINNYKDKFAMHCKTEEEAIDFCKYLHEHGRTWIMGGSYLANTHYDCYEQDTAYNFNEGAYSHIDFYERNGYTILEWSDFMNKPFTKADLKTGDVVMLRDGTVQIANCELGMFITPKWWNDIDAYNLDLTYKCDERFDIVAVRRPTSKTHCTFAAFTYEFGTLVYERQEVEEMTLEQVCKLLGKEIKIIK